MKYKKEDRVSTPHGSGTVEGIENYRKFDRILVKHDVQFFPWPVAAYFDDEVKKEVTQELVTT